MRTLTTCSFLNNIGDTPESIDSPLQLKLINFLGLKNYMIDNFIFRRKPTKYFLRKKNHASILITNQQEYTPPPGYKAYVTLIQTSSNSIPLLHLSPSSFSPSSSSSSQPLTTIIYAHGNGSDMSDSLAFVEKLSQFIYAEFVVFDYTGYGESRVADVGQEIIVRDLEIVLAWVTGRVAIRDVVLWGFSLGTYPVVVTAAKYPVSAVILQCPIASISCLFHTDLHPQMKFKEDHFANIDHITSLSQHTKILIMHSSDDQVIPFTHAKLLYQKYLAKNGENSIDFIEIAKIRHNSLHKYIVSGVENQLQREVFGFLEAVMSGREKGRDRDREREGNQSFSSINTENSVVTFREEQDKHQSNTKIKTMQSLPAYLTPSTPFPQKRKNLHLLEQLKSIRMKIIEPQLADIPADMHELVIEEEEKEGKGNGKGKGRDKGMGMGVRGKIIGKGVNCFCFQGQ